MARTIIVTEAIANQLYEIVEKFCGASAHPDARCDFVHSAVTRGIDEYRFQGILGFGGKLYSRPWRVSCYPEDRNNERDAAIQQANKALRSVPC